MHRLAWMAALTVAGCSGDGPDTGPTVTEMCEGAGPQELTIGTGTASAFERLEVDQESSEFTEPAQHSSFGAMSTRK